MTEVSFSLDISHSLPIALKTIFDKNLLMETLGNLTLKQVVLQQPDSAVILEKYNLDFCCKGGKTLQSACKEKEIILEKVLREIQDQTVMKNDSSSPDFNKMELDELADYIVNKHHAYVKEKMPLIFQHVQKISEKHGTRHSELQKISSLFGNVVCELGWHLTREEQILFPYIKEMALAKRNKTSMPSAPFGSIQNPINMMEKEHESCGNTVGEIKQLSSDYNPPADACTTFQLCYKELDEFEKDLHRHIHLENNILFPKAIELENI